MLHLGPPSPIPIPSGLPSEYISSRVGFSGRAVVASIELNSLITSKPGISRFKLA